MLGTIRVGHAGDEKALKGCTVFIPPPMTTCACDVRGGAPGTRETSHLGPTFAVHSVDAILISGGSAFGLSAADGVVRYLEGLGIGFPTPGGPVPIVAAAVIFDLDMGDASVRPGAEMAIEACKAATTDEQREGNVGVGLGATAGNVLGRARSTKSGFGFYRFESDFKLEVAAVANPFGEIVGVDGKTIAGVRGETGGFEMAEKLVCKMFSPDITPRENTTLVVIATNARIGCDGAARLALQGHNGIARAIRPSHTRFDGDTVFVLVTDEVEASQDALETIAALGTAEAIRSGTLRSEGAGGVPAPRELLGA